MAEADPKKPKPPSGGGSGSDKSEGGPYYAWNTFPVEWDETTGLVTEKIMPGEPITQSDLDVSDEEWESLIETGAVSEDEYPDLPPQVSPAEYQAQQDIHEAMVSVVEMHEAAMEDTLNPDDEEEVTPVATSGTGADKPPEKPGAATASKS